MKGEIRDLILELIEKNDRLISLRSLKRTLYYEYYRAREIEYEDWKKTKEERLKIEKIFSYLQKAGYLKIQQSTVSLTEKGIFSRLLNKSKKIKKQKNKKYYYLVIFDIPEKMRHARDLLRKVLYNFGSDRLQKSVFVIETEEGFDLIKKLIRQSKMEEFVKLIKCFR
jgi:CRISPR/Cas system-associated endoribonuclease Cas2